MRAAGDMDIDLSMSWMIGDIIGDVEEGQRAGCKTVLVAEGKTKAEGMVAARDLADAARKIVKQSGVAARKKREKVIAG
jgi:histidinol phosphatase-like enzyme